MEHNELEYLQRRIRAQMLKLMQVSDITKEMMRAISHHDNVSMTMLLSMREDPLRQLCEMDARLQDYFRTLPPETAVRLDEIVHGAAAQTEEETAVCAQVAQYRRLLKATSEMDERLSVHLGGKQSFYHISAKRQRPL